MRIALNLHGFTSGRGGVETYLKNLFACLQLVDGVNEYLILCDGGAADSFRPVRSNFQMRVSNYERPSFRWLARGVLQRVCGYDLLAREFASLDVDVMHHPLTVLNPPGLCVPAVLTFHDMQQEYFPEFFSAEELRRRRASYLPSVREARAIIAISAHAKACLVERYELPPEKIHVVYHGIADPFRLIGNLQELDGVMRKYSIQRPFMIYPAATWPHKNHLRLLAAVRLLMDRGQFDGELLLTGASMDAHSHVMSEIERLGLSAVVRWLGYLPYGDLPRLYNLARLMVFPSLFEGFGLPLVEAMACGCPVASARSASLPEVADKAALYFDPTSIEDMAETIVRVWQDDTQQNDLRQRGLLRASCFSWKRAALDTVDVYRRAVC